MVYDVAGWITRMYSTGGSSSASLFAVKDVAGNEFGVIWYNGRWDESMIVRYARETRYRHCQ